MTDTTQVTEALEALIGAVEWRAAVVGANSDAKKKLFADEQVWFAVDAAKAALSPAPAVPAPGQSREERMVTLERNSKGVPTVWCDPEIADVVAALNTHGLRTVASCSGHGHRPGVVALQDGRQLMVFDNEGDFKAAQAVFPKDINGDRVPEQSEDTQLLDWLEQNLFERKWGGTLGQPSEFFVRGDYRHTTQKMRGESLREAIRAARKAQGGE